VHAADRAALAELPMYPANVPCWLPLDPTSMLTAYKPFSINVF
jgi:hypothetical protein